MAKFAFACNFSPGGSDGAPLKELLTKVLGRAATLVEESCLRRPFNESYATVAADIRVQTEQTNEDSLCKLAPADCAARLEEQQKRLTGIDIYGPHEPGDTVADEFVSFYEGDRLQWISCDQCISREHELTSNNKKDQRLVVQSSRELKIASASLFESCDTSSEILLRYCFIRRALAIEQANNLAYHHHDRWHENHVLQVGNSTIRFLRTTFQQIEVADKKLFILLAERTRNGIKAGPDGSPCDRHFEACMHSTEVRSGLQPKPIAVRSKERPGYEKKGQHERPSKAGVKAKEKSTEPVRAHSIRIIEIWLQRGHASGQ